MNCKYCNKEILPAGNQLTVRKDRTTCGSKECEISRILDWHKSHKDLDYIKERKRINQRKYAKQERVIEMYKKYSKEYMNQYTKNKRRENEYFNIVERIRDRFRKGVNRQLSGRKFYRSECGIDFKRIAEYLGPCPGKRSEYHIDHIKPLCMFDLTDINQIRLAFSPENHQWLKKEDNLKKGGKYNDTN